MKIEEMEKTLEKIRERENFLVQLKKKNEMSVHYWSGYSRYRLYNPNKKELDFLKATCISEIKRLKETIECLTD